MSSEERRRAWWDHQLPPWMTAVLASDMPVEELEGRLAPALRAELAAVLPECAVDIRTGDTSVVALWRGGPTAREVATRLGLEWAREDRGAHVLTLWCEEDPSWPEDGFVTLVLRRQDG